MEPVEPRMATRRGGGGGVGVTGVVYQPTRRFRQAPRSLRPPRRAGMVLSHHHL